MLLWNQNWRICVGNLEPSNWKCDLCNWKNSKALPKGAENIGKRLDVWTLKKRPLLSLAFDFKIVNGIIDCPELLSCFLLRVTRTINSRSGVLLYLSPSRNHIMVNSPIFRPRRNVKFLYWRANGEVYIFDLSLSRFTESCYSLVLESMYLYE